MNSRPRFATSGERSQRAAIYEQFGEPIRVEPNMAVHDNLDDHSVLVHVASSSINPIDVMMKAGVLKDSFPCSFPIIPGMDVSGKIVKIGSKVTKFKVGDEVYGMPEQLVGTCAEYVAATDESIAHKPSKFSWNEAAGFPLTALTAYDGIVEHGQLTSGQSILILGGGSAVGNFGIQIAKAIGATVTATSGPSNVDWMKESGADVAIDYSKEDFSKVLAGQKFDLVFDAVASQNERDKAFDLVKPKGFVTTTSPVDPRMLPSNQAASALDDAWKKISSYITNGVTYKPFMTKFNDGYALEAMNKWIEDGKIKVKIDSVFPFDRIEEAFQKCGKSKVSGKVVIEITKM